MKNDMRPRYKLNPDRPDAICNRELSFAAALRRNFLA